MRRHSLGAFLHRALSALQWVTGVALAVVSAATKADPVGWPFAADVLRRLQHNAWVLIPILTACLGLIQVARSSISPPWVWETVQYLLDKFQEHVFEGQTGPPHHHRVTLFKYVRWRLWPCRWPWSRWLVPVVRSGHTTQRSRSAFLVPDDADQTQGIAGQTWAERRVVVVNGLPDINARPSEAMLAEYAQKTWVSVQWLQRRRQHARSFCGIPVEVKGKLWGVIVLDSRDAAAIDQHAIQSYSLIGRYLGKLLERA